MTAMSAAVGRARAGVVPCAAFGRFVWARGPVAQRGLAQVEVVGMRRLSWPLRAIRRAAR